MPCMRTAARYPAGTGACPPDARAPCSHGRRGTVLLPLAFKLSPPKVRLLAFGQDEPGHGAVDADDRRPQPGVSCAFRKWFCSHPMSFARWTASGVRVRPLQQAAIRVLVRHEPPQLRPELLPRCLAPPRPASAWPLSPPAQHCSEAIWNGDRNLLVAAPTGSGKTGLMELAICKLLHDGKRENGMLSLAPFSVLYFGPIKALTR